VLKEEIEADESYLVENEREKETGALVERQLYSEFWNEAARFQSR